MFTVMYRSSAAVKAVDLYLDSVWFGSWSCCWLSWLNEFWYICCNPYDGVVFFGGPPWIQCSLVLVHWCFRGKFCLHFKGQKVNWASSKPTRRKQEVELLDGCLLRLFFSHEDGSSTFLENISELLLKYTTIRHRPWYPSSGLMSLVVLSSAEYYHTT